MVWTCSSEFFGYVYNEIEKENTMNIQIFGTKKCNDTKKAERFFKERGIKFQLNKIAARWPAKAVAQFYFY